MFMTSEEIRKIFVEYFEEHGHLLIPSSSLVPENDSTLLLINSGMAPLKKYFTGERQPPNERLCNIQRCVRTNDIDSVGDPHHLTFFEMMGNWSIGDYFKETAIELAWGLIKDVFRFDSDRICVTVYAGDTSLPTVPPDEESLAIWSRHLSHDRIYNLGRDSNFWGPTSETGPCGPCTEVFFDRGLERGCGSDSCDPDCSCSRFIEIWNAGVFMEYSMNENGALTTLPIRSVDAGAGLDRFTMILQEVDTVYETDLFNATVEKITAGSIDLPIKSVRVIADHIRSAVFMIADGIYPGNTRMEYIVRRVIRRALMHSQLCGLETETVPAAAPSVINRYSKTYPILESSQEMIEAVIKRESAGFNKILSRGMKQLERIIAQNGNVIPGEEAFRLHDTMGFPLTLTIEVAQERGIVVDEEGYWKAMEAQKERSRTHK